MIALLMRDAEFMTEINKLREMFELSPIPTLHPSIARHVLAPLLAAMGEEDNGQRRIF